MSLFEYIHEGGKNYLKMEEAIKGDFITEMLIHNHIPGFVDAQLKSRNAENYIAYTVNGLIPLSQVVEIKKMTSKNIENLLFSLVKAFHGMEDFLLPLQGLVIDPKHIYQKNGKKEEFLWIYGGKNYETKTMVSLFEYLIDKTDYTDDRAVNMIYTMYQNCKNYEVYGEDMGFESLTLIFEKAEELLSSKRNEMDRKVQELMEEEERWMEPFERRREEKDTAIFSENFKEEKPFYERKTQTKKVGKEKNSHSILKTDKVKSIFQKAWGYLNSDIGSGKREEIVVEEEKEDYKLREVKVIRAEAQMGEGSKATALLTNGMVQNGIYCLKPEEGGESVLITSYPFFIGKAEQDVSLRIEDSTVSRFHARLDRSGEEFWLTDLNSTNGTFLNGIRLIPYERLNLKKGDSIVIARRRYEFRYMN